MEDYDIEGAMQILYVAKSLYDHGKLEKLLRLVGNTLELTWDNQSYVEYCVLECVFEDTKSYMHPEKRVSPTEYTPERMVYVFRDPLLIRYDMLCREYEEVNGIHKTENPYARQLEDTIHSAMQLSDYNYDYFWQDNTQERKGAKLVLFLYEEFSQLYALPEALFEILDFCEAGIKKLEHELGDANSKVIAFPITHQTQQREAA